MPSKRYVRNFKGAQIWGEGLFTEGFLKEVEARLSLEAGLLFIEFNEISSYTEFFPNFLVFPLR